MSEKCNDEPDSSKEVLQLNFNLSQSWEIKPKQVFTQQNHSQSNSFQDQSQQFKSENQNQCLKISQIQHQLGIKQSEFLENYTYKQIQKLVYIDQNKEVDEKPLKQLVFSDVDENQSPKDLQQDFQIEFQSDQTEQYIHLMDRTPTEKEFKDSQKYYSSSKKEFQNLNELKRLSKVKLLEKKLTQNEITVFNQQKPGPIIRIHNVIDYGNYQIVDLDVCVGKYQKNLKICNLLEESCFHSIKPFNSGSFGNIYLWKYFEQQFVVKCVSKTAKGKNQQYQHPKQKQTFLKEILKEYVIAYIAGILQIGPRVVKPFGFDLIVSQKCVEFYIERCRLPEYHLNNVHQKFIQIKDSLYSLHLLNIVHNDIKPENIMYNERTDKLLFIDFGLSEFLIKPIGYKKLTKFIGTFQYSSPQMQKLLFLNQYDKIDLYYNDAYSLNTSLNKLFQLQKSEQKTTEAPESPGSQKMIRNFSNKIFLKFVLWQQKTESAITLGNIMNLKNKFQLQKQILNFLKKLKFSPNLKHFYHECIHYSLKQLLIYKKLNEMYMRNLDFHNIDLNQKDQSFKTFQNLYQNIEDLQGEFSEEQTTFKQRFITKDQKMSILLNKQNNISVEKTWSLYLDFINFFKKNEEISIEQKYRVSKFLVEKLNLQETFSKKCSEKIQKFIKPILQFLYHLLKYCFQPSFNRWKRKNVILIITLMMVLGWKIPKFELHKWRYILLSNLNNEKDVLQIFLQFQFLEQIDLHQSNKFTNQLCLEELNLINVIPKELNERQTMRKQELVYEYFLPTIKSKHIIQENIFTELTRLIFQVSDDTKNLTSQNIETILKLSRSLNYSDFRKKSDYNKFNTNLLFWVLLKYVILRVPHQIQMQLLNQIRKNVHDNTNLYEIKIYHFQFIFKYSIFKNYTKLKESLDVLDKTINCKFLSQTFCISTRLLINYMLQDFNGFKNILTRSQELAQNLQNIIYVYKQIGYFYQNVVFYSLGSSKNEDFSQLTIGGIDVRIHQIICLFDTDKISTNIFSRAALSQLIKAIVGINGGEVKKIKYKYLYSKILFQNQHYYLSILDKLVNQYPKEVELKKNYVEAALLLLRFQGQREKIVQLLQKSNIVNFNNINFNNYNEVSIVLIYYESKFSINGPNALESKQKIYKIYHKLSQNSNRNYILSHNSLCCFIIANMDQCKISVQFFKMLTQFISCHPSVLNVQLFMHYVNLFKAFQFQRFQNDPQKAEEFFKQLYYQLKWQIGLSKLWENPYAMFSMYFMLLNTKEEKLVRQLIKMYKLIAKNMDFIMPIAKNMVLTYYYYYFDQFYNSQQPTQGLTKHRYLMRKHLKYSKIQFQYEELNYMRINNYQYIKDEPWKYPGFNRIKTKIFKYYENLDAIKRIDYVRTPLDDSYFQNTP